MSDEHGEQISATWGIQINSKGGVPRLPLPAWLSPVQKDDWSRRGIIVWDAGAKRVRCLSAHQALDVLDDLRESSSWKRDLFCLCWSAYSLPFSEEDRRTMRLSKNRREVGGRATLSPWEMCLSPSQTQELFMFLESHHEQIRQMADEDVVEAKKPLGRAYRLVLSWRREGDQAST